MSISAIAAPSRRIGTTISARVLMKHWRYRGSSFTSGTMTVALSVAAAPQMPSPIGIRRCRVALGPRSEEHTSELQSLTKLVCRLLLEKKKHQGRRGGGGRGRAGVGGPRRDRSHPSRRGAPRRPAPRPGRRRALASDELPPTPRFPPED